VAPDAGPLLELPPPREWLCLRPVRVDAASWVVDGGALIGDAAHALNPNAGQGTNQVLEDALVLAEILTVCLQEGRLGAQDLRPYEERRRPAAGFVQRMGETYAFLWTSSNPLVSTLQAWTARQTGRHPDIMRKVVAQTAGLVASPLTFREQVRLLTGVGGIHQSRPRVRKPN